MPYVCHTMPRKICASEVNACDLVVLLPACLSPCILRGFTKRERRNKHENWDGKIERDGEISFDFYSSIVFVFPEDSNDDLPPLLDRCGID